MQTNLEAKANRIAISTPKITVTKLTLPAEECHIKRTEVAPGKFKQSTTGARESRGDVQANLKLSFDDCAGCLAQFGLAHSPNKGKPVLGTLTISAKGSAKLDLLSTYFGDSIEVERVKIGTRYVPTQTHYYSRIPGHREDVFTMIPVPKKGDLSERVTIELKEQALLTILSALKLSEHTRSTKLAKFIEGRCAKAVSEALDSMRRQSQNIGALFSDLSGPSRKPKKG